MSLPCLGLAALGGLVGVASSQNVEIKAPAQVPDSAAPPITPSYLGLGFECKSWPDFAGDKATPNALSRGLIGTLTKKSGAPIIIRVGGTSQDNARYDPEQKEAVKVIGPDNGLQTPLSLGPTWLEAFLTFANAKYALMVPAQGRVPFDNAVQFATAALGVIDRAHLDAVEIGNEPNFYGRPAAAYARDFARYADAIRGNASLPAGAAFQAGAIASDPGPGWTARDVFEAGLARSGREVRAFALHYYQTFTDQTLRSTLLSHQNTVQRTRGMVRSSLDYLRRNQPDVPLVLGEVGSSLGVAGKPATPTSGSLDRVLGSALWLVDWVLFTMSEQGTNFNYAAWRPIRTGADPPVVHAQYYGLAFVADLLGSAAGKPLRVVSLYDGAARPNVSPYAGYVGGQLDRYVVLDLNEWNATAPAGARPERTFALAVPEDVKGAELRRLTGRGTDAVAADMTWAGQKFTVANPAGEKVGPETEEVKVQGGKAEFKLKASEAVLVLLKR